MPSIEIPLSFGISSLRYQYTPDKADVIQNMVITDDGTLRSVDGPTLYEPRHLWTSLPQQMGKVFSIIHGYFGGGVKEFLLVHAGRFIWAHWGAKRGWVNLTLPRPARADNEAAAQSTFVRFGDYIIFSDGAGPPMGIDEMYRVTNLGFAEVPAAPLVRGPQDPPQDEAENYAPDSWGYSWPGGLGTVGDRLNGDRPHLLKGSWALCYVYEDLFGNRSPLSPPSNAVELGPAKSFPIEFEKTFLLPGALGGSSKFFRTGAKVKPMRRGVAVPIPENVPDNCAKIILGRTLDRVRNPRDEFYIVDKFSSTGGAYHDRTPDSALSVRLYDNWPVPIIDAMTVDKGCLLALSGPYLYVSDPGFAGTFQKQNRLMLTADGVQGTAVFALQGRRYASTDRTILDVTDLTNPITVSNSIGVAGAKAWTALPGQAGIVFVSNGGVYTLNSDGITKISQDIENLWSVGINKTRLRNTVVWYSEKFNEVRIAVSKKGRSVNELILAYTAGGWRTYELGLTISCAARANDLELVGGFDGQTRSDPLYSDDDIYVLDKESPLYTPPGRQTVYETDFIPLDQLIGTIKGQVTRINFGLIETYEGEAATVYYEVDFDDGTEETHALRLDDTAGVSAHSGETRRKAWGSFLIGTDTFKGRRKVYRSFKTNIQNIARIKIRLETTYPQQLELTDIQLEFEVPGKPSNKHIGVVEV